MTKRYTPQDSNSNHVGFIRVTVDVLPEFLYFVTIKMGIRLLDVFKDGSRWDSATFFVLLESDKYFSVVNCGERIPFYTASATQRLVDIEFDLDSYANEFDLDNVNVGMILDETSN